MNYILEYENLQLGDIILESGHKPHSEAIKKFTKSNFSHSMICVEGMSIIHAEKDGIFSLNPQRLLVKNITDLKVLRIKKELSNNELKDLDFFLRDKIGSVYSALEAMSVINKNRNTNSNNKYQFCSRLVAQAYKYINYQIVTDVDFCSPADIEKSNLFYEVNNIIRKAEEHDINFALTKNMIKENQKSMYDWLNKTRDMADKQYNFVISKINDIDIFLSKYQNEDDTVSDFIIKSGYLKNYLIEINNNPHMHNEDIFIKKFQDIDNIIYALEKEFSNIPSHTNRALENYKNSLLNYENTNFNYYKLHIQLYKELLGVSLSKLITLFNVSKKLILDGIKNDKLTILMLSCQQNIEILQQLEIEKYNKT
jgi:hypothetical protein